MRVSAASLHAASPRFLDLTFESVDPPGSLHRDRGSAGMRQRRSGSAPEMPVNGDRAPLAEYAERIVAAAIEAANELRGDTIRKHDGGGRAMVYPGRSDDGGGMNPRGRRAVPQRG